MEDEKILTNFRLYNHWWGSENPADTVEVGFKRIMTENVCQLMMHKSLRRFVVLSGMRRVGKTTIMFQAIKQLLQDGVNPKNILYVTFDNPILRAAGIDAVLAAYEGMYALEGDKYLFLDEIQYTQDWELWMKVLYDSRKDLRIMATGSASPILEQGSSDSGTGRWMVVKVPTMSFYEYCLMKGVEIPEALKGMKIETLAQLGRGEQGDIMVGCEELQKHFMRYVLIGGFPELILSEDNSFAQRLLRDDVLDKVLKRDVLTLFNIRNPLLLEKLFLYLALNSGEIFNTAVTAKELDGVSTMTIDSYLQALEMSNLIYVSKPTSVGSKSVLKGKPKIYVADTSLYNSIFAVNEDTIDETTLGKLVELVVYRHLAYFYESIKAPVGYYRKQGGNQKEVDVVIEKPLSKILCEVKYRNNSQILAKDAIVELCSEADNKIEAAYVVTKKLTDYGQLNHETLVPIIRIPAAVFTFIVGMNTTI